MGRLTPRDRLAASEQAIPPALPEPQPRDLTPEQIVQALGRFEQELGGRDALVETLAHAAATKDQQFVLNMLASPEHATWSLAKICNRGGVSLHELWQMLRSAAIAKAAVKSTLVIADHLPGVVTDVMVRAQPHEITCTLCNGCGQITYEPTTDDPNPSPQACPSCAGKGAVKHQPDLARQVVALKLGGLLKDGSSFTINNLNQAIARPDVVGAFEATMAESDKALEEDVLEAEVSEQEDPEDIGEGDEA